MKKLLSSFILFAMLFVLSSCNDDEPRIPTYLGMGTLQKTTDVYSIDFDGASSCWVPDSSLLVYKKLQQPGKRVIAMYSFISDRRGEKSIALHDIVGVLTKPLAEKPATPQDEAKLGNDVLRIEKAWMGGGFLNVKFYYLTDLVNNNPHFINAFDTGEVDKDGFRIIEMRHNANGHQAEYISNGSYVSFAMKGGENTNSKIKVRYQYDNKRKYSVEVD